MQSFNGSKSSELYDLLVESLENLTEERQESDSWNEAIDELLRSMSPEYIDVLVGEAAFLSNAIQTGVPHHPSEFYSHCMIMLQERANSPNGELENIPRRPLVMPDSVAEVFLNTPGLLFLATCPVCAYQYPKAAFTRCPLEDQHRVPDG